MFLMAYFSEKELSQKPRTLEDLTATAWTKIVEAVSTRIEDGSFGHKFPGECYQCAASLGTNIELMGQAVRRQFPYLSWPLEADEIPHLYDALDLVQFCYARVSSPSTGDGHCSSSARHLAFDDSEGKREFGSVINGIFARESLAFHLDDNGEVSRLAPLVLDEALGSAVFNSGDKDLDSLLENARHKFLSHDANVRKESLEKLWDAWERLKSIENPNDKKDSATKLLDRACAEPNFRQALESEARALTDIGNRFMIRHTEVDKIPIGDGEHVDYLFHRMFAMIRLLLRSTNRMG
jgi:hypothetical protein